MDASILRLKPDLPAQTMHHSWIDLSHRIAEFNMSLALVDVAADVAMPANRVYSQGR
jgi:hypothetical protein